MFGSFLKSLLEPQAEPLHDDDARLAMTALLVRLARADNEYAAAEIHRITQVIMARYELAEPEAIALRESAETLEQEAPDTVRFTRAIKDRVAYEDRIAVVEALWQVALADGNRDAEEDALLRLVVSLLGVTDVDSASARRRVMQA
ncbi:TerB family tellurite resistance protein [Alphaproteobacteria bacterium US3C007]|nr:TerB family tellurite resistance protein [Alphaproteobacteria bacterium US3C007]